MLMASLIRYDERSTRPDEIVAAIRRLGYEAEVQLRPESERLGGGGESGYGAEARAWRRQLLGASIFSVPVFVISMVLPMTPLQAPLSVSVLPGLDVSVLLLWILTTPVQFGFGLRFYRSAYAALSHGATNLLGLHAVCLLSASLIRYAALSHGATNLLGLHADCMLIASLIRYAALSHGATNMDVLVALGSSAAYFYSLTFTVLSITSEGLQGENKQCFETSAMLITFILAGKSLEATARGKASEAMTALLTLQPPTALLCEGPWVSGSDEHSSSRAVNVHSGSDEHSSGPATSKPEPATISSTISSSSTISPATISSTISEPREVPVSSLAKDDIVKVLPGSHVPGSLMAC